MTPAACFSCREPFEDGERATKWTRYFWDVMRTVHVHEECMAPPHDRWHFARQFAREAGRQTWEEVVYGVPADTISGTVTFLLGEEDSATIRKYLDLPERMTPTDEGASE